MNTVMKKNFIFLINLLNHQEDKSELKKIEGLSSK